VYSFIISGMIMTDYEIYKELKSEFKSSSKNRWWSTKKYGKYKILLYVFILFLILFPEIVLFLIRKPYEYVDDINNLPEPTQTPASWGVTTQVFWEKVYIDFLAQYEVSWKIISVRDYIWADAVRELWPRDFVIWWWKMWRQEYIDKFSWNDMKDRYIYYRIKPWNEERFKNEFWWDFWKRQEWSLKEFLVTFSNNHPIPANRKIRLLMKKIKEWDVVRMKWYLVYVHPEKWNRYRWPSSLVRDDFWCEIMYVTDISRLKEK